MIPRRSVVFAALALCLTFLAGCAPRWRVVSQAVPDPFVNQRRFAVLPIDYAGLHIGEKSEPDYLSGKEPAQQQSFIADKVAINEEFAGSLISNARKEGIEVVLGSGPGAAPFFLRPSVRFVEPGFYAVVASAPSQVDLTLLITTPDGRVLDEVAFTNKTVAPDPTSIYGLANTDKLSSGGRLRADGRAIGELVAEYLASRVKP